LSPQKDLAKKWYNQIKEVKHLQNKRFLL